MRIYPVPFEGESVPEFAIDASRVGIITIPLDDARDQERLQIGGTFLWAVTASDNKAVMTIAFNQHHAHEGLPFKSGTSTAGLFFSEIFISNDAQAGKTITLLYTVEEAPNGIRIQNPTGDFSEIDLVKATLGSGVADITIANTITNTVGINAARRSLTVYALPTNTDYLRVGPTAAADRGYPLAPGASYTFTATSQFQIHNATGVDQKYGYILESD